ncbi:MAG: hypothetical protein M3R00_07635 [Pseudomonadota bacterium]|nr:hypothetical protein [Pseudomonadota bacterium]
MKYIIIILLILVTMSVSARDPFQVQRDSVTQTQQAHWWPLHHRKPKEVEHLVGSLLNLGPTEHVVADESGQGVWLYCNNTTWGRAMTCLQQLDAKQSEVGISAYIVELNASCLRELGVKWHIRPEANKAGSLHMDLPDTGQAQLRVAVLDAHLLALTMAALEQEGTGTVIARPFLRVQNGHEATIEAGTEVPYAEKTDNGGTSTMFKKAVLRLSVLPRVLQQQRLALHLQINHDQVSHLAIQGTPAIETQALQTDVVVKSGQTVVLGGLFTVQQQHFVESVPLLGQLPLLGAAFRWQNTKTERKELVVFLSPDTRQ